MRLCVISVISVLYVFPLHALGNGLLRHCLAALAATTEAVDSCREREQTTAVRLQELQQQSERIRREQAEHESTRAELSSLREGLYRSYQERRDRLAGLQQAVQTMCR